LVQSVVRLGTWLPFEQVPEALAYFHKVPSSPETARRLTEAAGAALCRVETAEVERLEREAPVAPLGPAVLQLSVDGAFVPLVHGEWTEVKTLALGPVAPGVDRKGRPAAQATQLSYFSRQAEAEAFTRLALGEVWRRGVPEAGTVCAVQDGAVWQQGFLDQHRPDAVRILDFPHAAEYVAAAGRAVFGAGTPRLSEWLGKRLHELRHGDPGQVLAGLGRLPLQEAADLAGATAAVAESLEYLGRRWEQIQYASFVAQGYPIGSGAVESANKLVVEARLKGSGMHWERANVNPMVALRALVCSDRWAEGWPLLVQEWRSHQAEERGERQRGRRAARLRAADSPPVPVLEVPAPRAAPVVPPGPTAPKLVVNGRPTAAHPWKQPLLSSAATRRVPPQGTVIGVGSCRKRVA
jgi:hypothetical protein